jgi:ESCRT-I complex subunit TSG101
MSSMDLTRDWLHTVTRPYSSRERLVPEVIDVLTSRRTLAVKTDAFSRSLRSCLALYLKYD